MSDPSVFAGLTVPCLDSSGHHFETTILDGEPSQVLAVCASCLTSFVLAPDWQWHFIPFGAPTASQPSTSQSAAPATAQSEYDAPESALVAPVVEADVVAPEPDTEPALVAADA